MDVVLRKNANPVSRDVVEDASVKNASLARNEDPVEVERVDVVERNTKDILRVREVEAREVREARKKEV